MKKILIVEIEKDHDNAFSIRIKHLFPQLEITRDENSYRISGEHIDIDFILKMVDLYFCDDYCWKIINL